MRSLLNRNYHILLCGFLLMLAALLAASFALSEKPLNRTDAIPLRANLQEFIPKVRYSMVVNNLFIEEGKIRKNQKFTDLLEGYFVSPRARQELNMPSKTGFDFRKIVAGNSYTLLINPDSVCSVRTLVYQPNPVEYIVFHLNDSLHVEACNQEVTTVEKSASGIIVNNLSEAINNLGLSHEMTNRIIDVLAWQIDFYRLQKGDEFKITYEERQVLGKAIGIGAITGIHFKHEGRDYFGIPFSQNNQLDYFDQEGNSLRKALLRYPIEFTRISSRYSLKRFHPVLKINRPHLGTDLSADAGTPIRTVGDGLVLEAGYKGGNGNYVVIRHNTTYTTGYLHMSRFGKGVYPGAKVRQGQTIGFVGSTGWATGPHLCYRFWKNGIQIDALKVNLPPAQPVADELRDYFNCTREAVLEKLKAVPFPLEPKDALAAR